MTAYVKAARERAMKRKRRPDHGTVNRYNNFGCRCPECREAWRVYRLERRQTS
jgi:hypothetical protein